MADDSEDRIARLEHTVNGNGGVGIAEEVRALKKFITELEEADIMTAIHDLKNAESARQTARKEQRAFNLSLLSGVLLLIVNQVFHIL